VQSTRASAVIMRITQLEKQLTEPSVPAAQLVELANLYLEAGRARSAVRALERAVAHHTEDRRAYLILGKAWEAEGDHDKALNVYVDALWNGIGGSEVEAALFCQDFLLKTYPRSVAELSIIAVRKNSAPLWRLLARVCETNADSESAITFVTEALRVKPDDVASMTILARLSERCQKMDDAEQWHRRILEVNPTLRLSQLFLARQHYRRGEYQQAIPYLERLLSLAQSQSERNDNRVLELYWLLARTKCEGLNGFADRIAKVQQWLDLTAEERGLARELLTLTEKKPHEQEQPQQRRNSAQTMTDLEASASHLVGQVAADETRQEDLPREEQEHDQRTNWRAKGKEVGLGIIAGFLILESISMSRLVWEWFQPPPPQEKPATPVNKDQAWTSQPQIFSGTKAIDRPQIIEVPQEQIPSPPGEEEIPSSRAVPKSVAPAKELSQEVLHRDTGEAVSKPGSRIANEEIKNQSSLQIALQQERDPSSRVALRKDVTAAAVKQPPPDAPTKLMQEQAKSTKAREKVPSPLAPEAAVKIEEELRQSAPAPVVVNPLSVLSAQLPHDADFIVSERLFAYPLPQLWQTIEEFMAQETDVLHLEDPGQGIFYGEVLQRELRPRVHNRLRPRGYYLVRVIPGATSDTSRVQVKILAFDWQTGRPAPNAKELPAWFFKKLEKKLDHLAVDK